MTRPAGRTGRPYRVLFLASHLGYGGSERQLSLLARHLDRSRWEPHILVYHPSPNRDHSALLRDGGIGVTEASAAGSRLAKLAGTVRCARRVRPHVVHSWSVHDNPYAAVAGRLAGVPVRWGSLRGSLSLPGFAGLSAWSRRLALRSVQGILVNSAALAGELEEHGVARSRVHVLPNCVEAAMFGGKRAAGLSLPELGIEPRHRVVLSVGNIRRVKNHALLVRALGEVVRSQPEVRGLVVGETLAGEEATRAALEDAIRGAGLGGKVLLAGFRADVPRLLAGAAALCLSSDSEGMPNVVLEAMASGCPVVATRVGGVPEVVEDGVTGVLVEPGDAAGLAGALCELLERPDRARSMAEAAQTAARTRHGCVEAATALAELYDRALVGGASGQADAGRDRA